MYYFVYRTTNLVNGKYYIGCHQTDNINDGYLGSGKCLKYAIKKYGASNFTKEIIQFTETKEDMLLLEKSMITKEIIDDELSYNLKFGGSGGNPGIIGAFSGKTHTEETKQKIALMSTGKIHTESTKRKLSINNWSKRDPEAHRSHIMKIVKLPKTDLHKQHISKSLIGKVHDIVTCPHCNKSGGSRAMKRYHFDNCKK